MHRGAYTQACCHLIGARVHGYMHTEGKRHKLTDPKTGRHCNAQTDRQAGRHNRRRLAGMWPGSMTHIPMMRPTQRPTQTYKDTESDTHTHIQRCLRQRPRRLQCQMTLSSTSSFLAEEPGSLEISSPFLLEISTLMSPAANQRKNLCVSRLGSSWIFSSRLLMSLLVIIHVCARVCACVRVSVHEHACTCVRE